ncbi:hypothetical protein B0H34DRAFT_716857 [Crassisporium funariophilum]|nr:hypothetical protein B0H34DRAFT_716857 [Crassisporium funariophilum]
MEFALAAANYLQPIADVLVYINTTKVHPVWFPYPLASTLHAARISMVYQANARRSPTPLSWGTYLTGYLIMCWGGGLLSHFLLGLPPPMLYSFSPSINYITVHLVMTVFFKIFPDLLHLPTLDTILFPMDAILRTNAVTSILGLLYNPNVHPEYTASPLAHMVLGAVVSAGGGFTVSTLGAWHSNWSFSTPPVLRAGAGWVGTMDLWGGALVAFIYSASTGHPAYASFSTYIAMILSSPLLPIPRKPHADSDFPPLSTLGAKSLAAAVLMAFFGARVIRTHWLKPVTLSDSPPKLVPATTTRKLKKKTQ